MTAIGHPTATASEMTRQLGVLRLAAAGAAASASFFLLCWVGALVSLTGASHMYIALFTAAKVDSAAAFVEGFCWSLLFGAIAGVLVAFFYNLFAAFDRR